MLSKQDAQDLVEARLCKISPSDNPYVVVGAGTIEKPYGWVFFYSSKKYLETGTVRYALAGNGPVFVNKETGCLEFCGVNKPVQVQIEDYETRLAQKPAG